MKSRKSEKLVSGLVRRERTVPLHRRSFALVIRAVYRKKMIVRKSRVPKKGQVRVGAQSESPVLVHLTRRELRKVLNLVSPNGL